MTVESENGVFDVTLEQPILHYGPEAVATNVAKYDGIMGLYHLQRLATGIVYEKTGEEVPVNMSKEDESFARMFSSNPYVAEFLETHEVEDETEWRVDFSGVGMSERLDVMVGYLTNLREQLVDTYGKMIEAQKEENNG